MAKKSTVRLFMVPIYIKVEDGFDHGITLAGCLGHMQDNHGDMFVDTERMIDCGQMHGDDIPSEGIQE